MTLRRIDTGPGPYWDPNHCQPPNCLHPEHNVPGMPGMIVLEPGTWENTCPGCGKKTVFHVSRPTLSAGVVVPIETTHWSKT